MTLEEVLEGFNQRYADFNSNPDDEKDTNSTLEEIRW
jgi:hypothetical protein